MTPNNRMQRCVRDKVLGRGRSIVLHLQVCLARVLMAQRARADAGRSATRALCSLP
jgi:hypothetical protein